MSPYLENKQSQLLLGNFLYALLVPVLFGWIAVSLRVVKVCSSDPFYQSEYFEKSLIYVDSFYVLAVTVALCLNIIVIANNGVCPEGEIGFLEGWDCSWYKPRQMPEDMMMGFSIMPAVLGSIVKGTKWEVEVLSFIIITASNFAVMFYFDLTDSLQSLCMFIPICLMVMYDNRRQSIALFLTSQNQENLLKEIERLAAETHANELRSMIGNVAHDLKTPLSAFVSGMDFITSILSDAKGQSGSEAEKASLMVSVLDSIHNMKNVNEFMLMTINRCIDYTKASQGLKLVPRMETINFSEAINLPLQCVKDLQQENKKIEIKLLPINTNISEQIITDKLWLQENILCLLGNAVKFSVGGVVTITASLTQSGTSVTRRTDSAEPTSTKAPAMIRIEIEDSGIGISEDMMINLFNPFKQAQRMAGGTGLGLYSLAKRIEALGGSYGVKRRKDGHSGSLFWFTIPYRPDDSKPVSPKFTDSNSAKLRTTSSRDEEKSDTVLIGANTTPVTPHEKRIVDTPLKILVVDDSLSILKMSSMMLRRLGHTVATAENGAIAVDMVASAAMSDARFDVVLMDLQMPVMDGLEATSRIRKLETASSVVNCKQQPLSLKYGPSEKRIGVDGNTINLFVPSDGVEVSGAIRHQLIIGVSANSDNETMNAAFEAGIDAFIPKPFTMQSFKDTYNGLLNKKDGL